MKQPTVLFEDDSYLIINKPAGLIVHSDGRTDEPSVVSWLMEKYPAIKDVGETLNLPDGRIIERPGIVHRIDRDTSGVLVIAKTVPAFGRLKKQFQKREVRKIYHAFLYGELKQDEGWIDRPIGRSPTDFRRWSATRGSKGEKNDALTYFRVVERNHGVSFVEVQPKTGRTHQIRVHFKAINYPVVCDRLYAADKPCFFGFGRTALHARSIEFVGIDDVVYKAEAPYPDDFEEGIKQFHAPAP